MRGMWVRVTYLPTGAYVVMPKHHLPNLPKVMYVWWCGGEVTYTPSRYGPWRLAKALGRGKAVKVKTVKVDGEEYILLPAPPAVRTPILYAEVCGRTIKLMRTPPHPHFR